MSMMVKRATGGAMVARVLGPGAPFNRLARRMIAETASRLRYASGRLEGLEYRMAGRHPDPGVSDDILADRIRSELGKIEKQRDLPHVHVMVEKHVALLHGEVPGPEDAEAIEKAVSAVSGVKGLRSHLHVGLLGGDTRPSEGHRA